MIEIPTVVNQRNVPNASMTSSHVYIGRPRGRDPWLWGNPYRIGQGTTRETCLERYWEWLLGSDDPRAGWQRENIASLSGKTLVCYCAPRPCHGDLLRLVLIVAASRYFSDPNQQTTEHYAQWAIDFLVESQHYGVGAMKALSQANSLLEPLSRLESLQ